MAISERLSNLLLTALGEVESHVELRLLLNTVFSDPVTTKGDLFTYSTVPARLAAGTNGQVLTADSTAATGLAWTSAGAGDVNGPASSTDKALVRFNSTTGKLLQNSAATLSDAGVLTAVGALISGATVSTVPYFDASKNLVSSAVTPTQLSYVDFTSSGQTQMNTKAPSTAPTFATSTTFSYATASTVPYWDASKNLISSAVTPTQLGYLGALSGAFLIFSTIQTDAGTAPVADSATDTLTLTSADASITITGNSSTDTVDFKIAYGETADGNSGASKTLDLSGNKLAHSLTLTANCTITLTAPTQAGSTAVLRIIQDATGSRTITWPAAVHWPGNTAPTLTTTAAQEDLITLYWTGTNYRGNSSLNYNP